jgi:preprotein translocase subunit Sec63
MAEEESFVQNVFNSEMDRPFPGEKFTGRRVNGYEVQAYNAFKILDVTLQMSDEMDENAWESTIKLSFRQLSLLWHPDKTVLFPSAEKELAVIKYRDITTAKV